MSALREVRRDPASGLHQRILGEFHEMPCLALTEAQAARLFNLTRPECQRVLGALVQARRLRLRDDGRYTRGEGM